MTRREAVCALLAGPSIALAADGGQPPRDDESTDLTLAQALDAVARGRLSPAAIVEAYLLAIGRKDGDIHAYVTVAADRARAAAQALERRPRDRRGTLYGIPIAHKDLFETAGIRTTGGSRLFDTHVPARDAALVAALARAGAVTLGKTNTHELGGGVTTINPFFGTTRNPVDPARIAGGSSGGSAAAVAARLTVAATGSDTGGSVRIPAAFCGCVGFKPSFGVLSTAGLLGACPTFDHVGFLARTAEDAARLFDAARNPEGAPRAAGVSRPARPRGALRIGVARRFFFDRLQSSVAGAIERALDRAGSTGATIVDRHLPVDAGTMARVFDPIVVAEIWSRWGDDWRRRPDAFSPGFAMVFSTPAPSASEVADARATLSRFRMAVEAAFEGLDVIATPTVPVTAPPIAGSIDGGLILRNTWPFNAARSPALSIPCGVDEAGLPVGLQIAGRIGADDVVLGVGRQLEALL